jgi:multiple sugar transport system permease protein
MNAKQNKSRLFSVQLRLGNVFSYLVLVLLLFITIAPLWWVVRTALTSPRSIYTQPSSLTPINPTTQNFERVLGLIDVTELVGQTNSGVSPATLDFWLFLKNTLIVASLVTLGQTTFSSMAAYAFARIRFPFRNTIFYIYLIGLMIPSIVLFIPNFVFIRHMGWIGTYKGIVAPSFFMTPFAVFFMRQFFLGQNKELEEAATLDGATKFGVFWRIGLPLSKGPILTLAILTFIQSWNDYLWPLLVGRDEKVRVLTVALGIFRQQTPQGAPDWAGLMAGATVSLIPTLIIFIFFGRKVVNSIQFTGFK